MRVVSVCRDPTEERGTASTLAGQIFPFLLADYENVDKGYGWAGRDVRKDESQVRELFRAAVKTGEITYQAGNGRGKFGKFVFVRVLDKIAAQERDERAAKGREKGEKGRERGRKGRVLEDA